MEIIYIVTQNVSVAKEMLVRTAIKAGMSYVEMENEVIIEYNYLFRIISNKKILDYYNNLIDVSMLKDFNMCGCYLDHVKYQSDISKITKDDYYLDSDNISYKHQLDIPKFVKSDYKRESKKVNSMVKTKQQYNRRRYR